MKGGKTDSIQKPTGLRHQVEPLLFFIKLPHPKTIYIQFYTPSFCFLPQNSLAVFNELAQPVQLIFNTEKPVSVSLYSLLRPSSVIGSGTIQPFFA